MSKPKLIIFDCDGVLVDSEVISNEVLARELTAEGLPTTLTEARAQYQGLLLGDIARQAGARLGRELPESWIAHYEQVREEAFRRDLRAVDGARELVEACHNVGLDVCVASQGKLAKTRLSLKLTGLTELFAPDALFSAHDVARGKPFPDLFIHAAEAMGATPSESVVVEDTPSGVEAAVTAEMRVLAYAADSDPQALRAAGGEIVMSLAGIPRALGLAGVA
jgi:HAD superfamily hydrolase (TIGR01509 family)